jgi:hypothetical protein
MLPASDLSEILANLSALNLQPNTAAQILAAVLAPLLRSSDPDPPEDLPRQRASRPRVRLRRAARRKKPKHRAAATPAVQNEHSGRNAPRQRAIAALRTNPDATPSEIAKVAKCSRSTVVNARETLAAEARKLRENPVLAKQTERRQRAQRFLREQLARGPQPITDVEQAAEKAHLDVHALEQARADLGVVTSRGNTGGVQAVQWSLPG